MSAGLNYMLCRLTAGSPEVVMDWLSRLFEMMPVRGRLDLRCSYGAPWRIDQGPGAKNEIPFHAVVAGSAILDDPAGGPPLRLTAGDILLLPGNPRHVMHDGSGARRCRPATGRPSTSRSAKTWVRTSGSTCCADSSPIAPAARPACCAAICRRAWSCTPAVRPGRSETAALLAGLVSLMRSESADDHLGGRAMLNALSTAMFALVLRLASETDSRAAGSPRARRPSPSGAGAGGAV